MCKTIESYDDSLVFVLPGQGKQYDTCQTFATRAHDAGDEWHYQHYLKDCGRYECPVCPGWRNKEALSIMDRLMGFAEQTGRAIIHYVVSPAPQIISKSSDYKSLRAQMYKVARKMGIHGGVAIFHYFRHPSPWNDRDEIEPDNPHWHVLGDGWVKSSQEVPGWVVWNLKIRRTKAQVRSTINYVLKWASRGSSLYSDLPHLKIEIETWFGTMAYNQLHILKFTGEGFECSVCGEIIPANQWHEVVWLKGDPPSEPSGKLIPGAGNWEISLGFDSVC